MSHGENWWWNFNKIVLLQKWSHEWFVFGLLVFSFLSWSQLRPGTDTCYSIFCYVKFPWFAILSCVNDSIESCHASIFLPLCLVMRHFIFHGVMSRIKLFSMLSCHALNYFPSCQVMCQIFDHRFQIVSCHASHYFPWCHASQYFPWCHVMHHIIFHSVMSCSKYFPWCLGFISFTLPFAQIHDYNWFLQDVIIVIESIAIPLL